MSDSKIYMFPDGNQNSNAALWAAMANKNDSPLATAAMMNGGMNGMWNNPLKY